MRVEVTYDLMVVNKPNKWGHILFPEQVVKEAIDHFRSQTELKSFGVPLELCRYESDDDNIMRPLGRTSQTDSHGMLIETIGKIAELWIVDGTVKCKGNIPGDTPWPHSMSDYVAIPYMTFKHDPCTSPVNPAIKRVARFMRFTEIVLTYQAVTLLALRKMRSSMGVSQFSSVK